MTARKAAAHAFLEEGVALLLATVITSIASGACTAQPPTQILVVVESDLPELDEVILRADLAEVDTSTLRGSPVRQGEPLSFALLHEGGALGPLTLVVEGMRGSQKVVERRARTNFVAEKVMVLRMDLFAACATISCPVGATCTEEGCLSLDEAGARLRPWSGSLGEPPPPAQDAGGESPVDGAPEPVGQGRDAGPDGTSDTQSALPPDAREQPVENSPSLGTCDMFPGNKVWRRDVLDAAVAPQSGAYVASLAGAKLGMPFLTDRGIVWRSVSDAHAKVAVTLENPGVKADWPVPLAFPLSSAPDNRLIVVNTSSCMLLEAIGCALVGSAFHCATGGAVAMNASWVRQRGSVMGTDSALALMPGLVRFDEVSAGKIDHALALTLERVQKGFVAPALNHVGGSDDDAALPPMGAWFRLKAGVSDAGLSPGEKAIVRALKTFEAIVTHRGPGFALMGESHARWNELDLSFLETLTADDFEVLTHEPISR